MSWERFNEKRTYLLKGNKRDVNITDQGQDWEKQRNGPHTGSKGFLFKQEGKVSVKDF